MSTCSTLIYGGENIPWTTIFVCVLRLPYKTQYIGTSGSPSSCKFQSNTSFHTTFFATTASIINPHTFLFVAVGVLFSHILKDSALLGVTRHFLGLAGGGEVLISSWRWHNLGATYCGMSPGWERPRHAFRYNNQSSSGAVPILAVSLSSILPYCQIPPCFHYSIGESSLQGQVPYLFRQALWGNQVYNIFNCHLGIMGNCQLQPWGTPIPHCFRRIYRCFLICLGICFKVWFFKLRLRRSLSKKVSSVVLFRSFFSSSNKWQHQEFLMPWITI